MLDPGLVFSWTENYVTEPAPIRAARNASLEHGIEPITPAMGSFLASLVAYSNAQSIVEVGTGLGVASQWLLAANTESHLTSIEKDVDEPQNSELFNLVGILLQDSDEVSESLGASALLACLCNQPTGDLDEGLDGQCAGQHCLGTTDTSALLQVVKGVKSAKDPHPRNEAVGKGQDVIKRGTNLGALCAFDGN
jgi:hypothetical protein